MLNRKSFKSYINFIKEKNEQQNKLCSILEDMSPGCFVDAFIYAEYEQNLLSLIKEVMALKEDDDILDYWMYDLDYGKNYTDGCFTDPKTKEAIDISTIDKLYTYLTKDLK